MPKYYVQSVQIEKHFKIYEQKGEAQQKNGT